MKLSATLKNNRGGQKTTADDTRILIELRNGNKIVGTIGYYRIKDWPSSGNELGYRIVLDNTIIKEIENKAKQLSDNKCTHQNCDDNGNCYACDVNVF